MQVKALETDLESENLLLLHIFFFSLFLLSADSFSSVMWPMKYKVGDVMTSKRALIAVAVVWLISLAVSIMPIVAEDLVVYGMSSQTFQFIPIIRPIPVSTTLLPMHILTVISKSLRPVFQI